MKNSSFLSWGKSDAIKAFWLFLIASVVSIVGDAVLQAINSGHYSVDAIHWNEAGAAIVVAVISYLKKKLLTNSNDQFLIKEKP